MSLLDKVLSTARLYLHSPKISLFLEDLSQRPMRKRYARLWTRLSSLERLASVLMTLVELESRKVLSPLLAMLRSSRETSTHPVLSPRSLLSWVPVPVVLYTHQL